ncbi:hypothetical protein DPMN_017200 [Dreissena polymorpha]|uniref:Uncharacterized protein n=1 Tax=Dreissena polymorpha TaxID=45954 RepID=A0A9D4NCR0_DREPO|nr:hypothetical protein DPMN_017200 [Dreissena polymorpha]
MVSIVEQLHSAVTSGLTGSVSLNNSILPEILSTSSFHALFSTTAMSASIFPHSDCYRQKKLKQ